MIIRLAPVFPFFYFFHFLYFVFFFVAVFFFGGFGVAVSASSAVVSFAVVCCLGRPCGPALLLCLLLLFGAAVWASSAVVCFCSCLGRPCGPALLLYFFVLFGAAVWASCVVVVIFPVLVFGGARWASSTVFVWGDASRMKTLCHACPLWSNNSSNHEHVLVAFNRVNCSWPFVNPYKHLWTIGKPEYPFPFKSFLVSIKHPCANKSS